MRAKFIVKSRSFTFASSSPGTSLLTMKAPLNVPAAVLTSSEFASLPSVARTALALLAEQSRGSRSPFHAYLSRLPTEYPLPERWTAAERALLGGTTAGDQLAHAPAETTADVLTLGDGGESYEHCYLYYQSHVVAEASEKLRAALDNAVAALSARREAVASFELASPRYRAAANDALDDAQRENDRALVAWREAVAAVAVRAAGVASDAARTGDPATEHALSLIHI